MSNPRPTVPTVRDLIERHTENRWVTLRAASQAVLADLTCRNCGGPLGDDFYDTDQCEDGWGPQCHGCGSAGQ